MVADLHAEDEAGERGDQVYSGGGGADHTPLVIRHVPAANRVIIASCGTKDDPQRTHLIVRNTSTGPTHKYIWNMLVLHSTKRYSQT